MLGTVQTKAIFRQRQCWAGDFSLILDWFLHDNGLRHERVKVGSINILLFLFVFIFALFIASLNGCKSLKSQKVLYITPQRFSAFDSLFPLF